MQTRANFSAKRLCLNLLLSCMIFFLGKVNSQTTIPCDDAFYLITSSTGGSVLQKLNHDRINNQVNAKTIDLSEPKRRITCLGYSVNDQFLYALDFDTYELLQIDGLGKIKPLGVPPNLDTRMQYFAGHVAAQGRTLVVIGRDPATQTDKIIFTIGLRAPYLASSQALISDLPVALTDLATHPFLGVVYCFDSKAKRFGTLVNGLVSTHRYPNIPEYITALYLDQSGNLYGYGNFSGDSGAQAHFDIDRQTGKMISLGLGIQGKDSDGCSCPYSLDFDMKITPTEVLPCSEITIEYTFFNQTGANWQDLVFRDSLPAGVTITAIEKNSANLSTVQGGIGSSLFRLINMNLILESNTIRLKAWVDELPPGKYSTQAVLQNLPKLYGNPLISDNSLTAEPRDSAFFTVIEPRSLKLNSKLRFSCNGDTAFVEAPLEALSYQWSDGSTGKTLVTTRSGRYSLLAKTACLDYIDTIEIAQRPPALKLEIEAPARLESGDRSALGYTSNETAVSTLTWSASTGLNLSCTDCPQPELNALSSGSLYLTLRNAQGCTLKDSAQIEVIPVRKVYIPNVFSPNADQHNDVFFIQGRDGGQILRWRIKDRWGNVVFEKKDVTINDAAQGWDGMVRGQALSAGTFFYEVEVEFPDGEKQRFRGEVKLLR
ncbi:MAG: gliding motility-associated C-terminal domain-containing protein [Haliscomenobacter sp.]|nr:gliding motility-associated C-terminal domain-containing protein [Haliscomenobacter sp.]MBK9488480.1 gliding motility-associated C-terminal domain-containing protein [Haliscomenobacter sp.]